MRVKDFVVGESYRFKDHPHYGYAKCVKILRAKEGENIHPYAVIKCAHIISKNDNMGFVRYFRPRDLIRDTK